MRSAKLRRTWEGSRCAKFLLLVTSHGIEPGVHEAIRWAEGSLFREEDACQSTTTFEGVCVPFFYISNSSQVLHRLSERSTDIKDKLRPSIVYLQKLGPEYLDIIFKFSRWVFERDADMAFEVCHILFVESHWHNTQIFLSEDVELPHQAVASYLESIDPKICAQYLEFIIHERHEESPVFHDRLAELYIKMTLMAKRRNENGECFYSDLPVGLSCWHVYRDTRGSIHQITEIFEHEWKDQRGETLRAAITNR